MLDGFRRDAVPEPRGDRGLLATPARVTAWLNPDPRAVGAGALRVGASRGETEAPMRHWLSTEWDVAAWSESTIEHAIRGSVKECVEQLRAHVASGVDRLILIPYRYEPAQVEIITREIFPALRRSADGRHVLVRRSAVR